jgi:regulatory protein
VHDGQEPEKTIEAADVRRAAMNLLARREYARRELGRRLTGKGMPSELVDQVLDDLAAENLQSDARFAESFVSARSGRGQGPVRIRMELEQRGVESGLIENALDDAGVDWGELATEVRRKRFGPKLPGDFRERARQSRFLQYRGFEAGHLARALGRDD